MSGRELSGLQLAGASLLFVATILLVLTGIVWASPAPLLVQCEEKGWYFGYIPPGEPDDGMVRIVGHGPLRAWRQEQLTIQDSIGVRLDTSRMYEGPVLAHVVVAFVRRVRSPGHEPYWKVETEVDMQQRTLRCLFTSDPDEVGGRWAFGNLVSLAGSGHPSHARLETFETLDSDN